MGWFGPRLVVHTRPKLFGGGVPLALLIGFLLLWGCFGARGQQAAGPEDRDVEWFLDNPDALDGTTRACRANPGRRENSADCRNAQAARVAAARREIARAIARAEAAWPGARAVPAPMPEPRAPQQRRARERRT